jgi:aldose 1-epimerase
MTQAANYSAQRTTVDSVEIVRLSDAAHHIEVAIAPSIGNIAYEMKVNGKAILLPPGGSLSEWKAKPAQAGIPFLAPWANRLDADAYWVNGKKYLLNPDVVALRRDPNGLPIHGLVLFASDWQITSLKADDQGAEVTSRLDYSKHPEWMAQFPFAHSIEMTHKLAGGVLEVRTAIENHSREPMPLSIGFHPWYQIPDCPRDAWKVHLPVREHYTLSDKLIPTGVTTPVKFDDPTSLSGLALDDVFGAVSPGEEFWVEGNGAKISVRFGPKFPVAVIYAPQNRNIICFEPMTGVTDAFNLAHAGLYQGLQSVPPGERWVESFWIRPSGF